MKKIYSLLSSVLFVMPFTVSAQFVNPMQAPANKNLPDKNISFKSRALSNASRSLTDRWYMYGDAMNLYWEDASGVSSVLKGNNLFPDSTILVDYGGTFGGPWIHSLSDVLDPRAAVFNDPLFYPNELQITSTMKFKVDSVRFYFIYDRGLVDPSIVDTLIFNVAVGTTAPSTVSFGATSAVATNLNGGTAAVQFKYLAYDSIANQLKFTAKKTYKIALDESTLEDTIPGGIHFVEFSTADVPVANAGGYVYSAVGFKPGYTWEPNVDLLDDKNSVYFLSYKEQDGSYPQYTTGNLNVSYILPQDVRYNMAGSWNGYYIPSYAYMGGTAPTYNYEHHLIEYKVSDIPAVGEDNSLVSNSFRVSQNQPNPCSDLTFINYELPSKATVNVNVYDVTGKKIMSIREGEKAAGKYAVKIDAVKLPAGVYYYTLTANDNTVTRKMSVVK